MISNPLPDRKIFVSIMVRPLSMQKRIAASRGTLGYSSLHPPSLSIRLVSSSDKCRPKARAIRVFLDGFFSPLNI